MKVMMLANEAPGDFALRDDPAKFESYMGKWYAFGEMLQTEGYYVDGAALEQAGSATVVSVRDGVRKVEDGPYPDTKEQLGGFFILDAPNLESAATLAAKCPAAENGFVDVRPVPFLEDGEH